MNKTNQRILDKIKAHPAVRDVFSEFGNLDSNENDWWIYLKSGYQWEDCHGIHEQTLSELWRELKTVKPCSCDDCTKGVY